MSKFLGSVEYGNIKDLEEIANEIGYSTSSNAVPEKYQYLDAEAVWEEAEDYVFQNGGTTAEIRLDSTDYIEVWDIPSPPRKYFCPECGRELEEETETDYPLYCSHCDENFHEFEAD